jgi:ubiquinone/menaquinone biosynthesis C-methylase UbiE
VNKWGKKRSVMRRYNLTAQMYDQRYCEEQEAKYKVALENLNLTPESAVLDVGCGSGMFFNKIAPKVETVVGIDVSRELLLLAKQRAKELGNVSLVFADADNLPFKQAIFGNFFVFTVLQNMPNPAKTLKELQFSALPDAKFVVTGLKAAVSLEQFGTVLDKAGLDVVSLRDDKALQCHVVTAVRSRK